MTQTTRLPLPPTKYVIGIEGDGYSEDRLTTVPAWDDEAMHAYSDAENAALRAELASTNERWEKSHQIALAIQDERDALRAEVERLREDAGRGRYMIANGGWYRSDEQTRLSVLVPHGSDLSCRAMREAAIDAARKAAP